MFYIRALALNNIACNDIVLYNSESHLLFRLAILASLYGFQVTFQRMCAHVAKKHYSYLL